MFNLVLLVLDLVLLGCFWLMSEAEFRTKIIFTVLFLLIVGWIFLEPWTGLVAEGILATILWWLTFGPKGR